ncbi:glutaredoxin family protein [Aquiluna borgnonia]|uniref:Glutaredoxin family protein n=1 Tax=Aquiluna borgnonia TaxID=2499157 RepID=A0A7D4Q5M1_9MICO|nr:glutaredoxin family protein [Aquiluna borgnonia]QKJ25783.1 glutaredoxin family protein [Aquiluna borgnonia]
MPVQIELTLIVRQGCHLCEAAEAELSRVMSRFAAENPETEYTVDLVEIDSNPDFAKFSDEIPVLLINGKQVAFWRIDAERVFGQLMELV